MLGFAIVGCGMIARFHARALADVPKTRIVVLVSRSAASAQKMKDELVDDYGVVPYTANAWVGPAV